MEFKRYLAIVRKWWWLMVLATGIAGASSYAATRFMPRIYQAQATVMVGQATQSLDPNYNDFFTAERLGQTYIQLATTQLVLQAAIDDLALDTTPAELASRVNVSPVPSTQLLRIRVVDTDPERAAITANGLAEALQARSPSASDPILQQNRAFIEAQIKDLQARIEESQRVIPQMEASLSQISSARALQDRQQEIAAEETKITAWRATYASLLNFLAGSNTNTISMVDPATPQNVPISPDVRMYVVVAVVLGLTISAGAALVLDYLDDTIQTYEDVERVLGSVVLAPISRIAPMKEPADALVTVTSPTSESAEAYRVLRANVQFSMKSSPAKSVVITSAGPEEGKSITLANLGVSMAQAGRRVVLVDSDLRRPSLDRILGVANTEGLSNLLLQDDPDPESVLRPTSVDGLRLLTSGPMPPNPAELLSSPEMEKVIAGLAKVADVVLYDSPPILAVADAAILLASIGEAIMVVQYGAMRSDGVRRARETLEQTGARLLGVVLNRMPRSGAGGYYHYHSYYSAGEPHVRNRRRIRWPWGRASEEPAKDGALGENPSPDGQRPEDPRGLRTRKRRARIPHQAATDPRTRGDGGQ